jgi:hypothetical protein
MRTYTKPVKPRKGSKFIITDDMANHARCIEELQRAISPEVKPKRPKKPVRYIHPWKVTANGDDTVYVGEGRIHSFLDSASGLASLSHAGFGDWEGGNVEVTAEGVIYGEIVTAASYQPVLDFFTDSSGESGDVQITLLRVFPDVNASIAVGFAATMPISNNKSYFYWEIAQVDLVSGVAVVTKQVLRHDPTLFCMTETS